MGGFLGDAISTAIKSGVASSGERAIEETGVPGQLLTNALRSGRQLMDQLEGTYSRAVEPDFKALMAKGETAIKSYVDFFKKGVVPADPEVGQMAVKHKSMMYDLYTQFKAQPNTKVAPLVGGNYFPNMAPEASLRGDAAQNRMIQHLITTNQATDAHDAMTKLGFLKSPEPSISSPFHHIESPRTLDLPDAREDPGVIYDYLTKGARRLGEIKSFGQQGEKLSPILSAILQGSGKADYTMARSITSSFLGHNFEAAPRELERNARAYEAVTKLGLSPLNVASKSVNMVSMSGLGDFVKGFAKTLAHPTEGEDFANNAGAVVYQVGKDMRKLTRQENQNLLSSAASKVYMNPSENLGRAQKFMRIVGANVGSIASQSEFDKLAQDSGNMIARRRLNTLGIDVDAALKRGSLSDVDKAKAGYNFTRMTMFDQTPLDVPKMWKDSWATRLATMYKNYAFAQTKFVKDQILKPALGIDGPRDIRPLLWAMVTFPTVGEIVGDVKTLAHGRSLDSRPDFKKYPFDRVIDNISQIGGFGIMQDSTTAMTSGDPLGAYRFITGPAVGDVVDTAIFPASTMRQKEAFMLRHVPIFGPALAEKMAPPAKHNPSMTQRGVVTKTLTGEQ